MSAPPAIKAEQLGKEYVIGGERPADSFSELLAAAVRNPLRRLRRFDGKAPPEERIWALRDISFAVNEGEVVGIIGRNGAGKSTLLKILSRITPPTEGRVEIRGRVGSLLEVGTGFHPELTGRENVYLNGAILGMTRKQIDAKFEEIVDFAGVEKFLDTPVKRYSTGMYMRLAFAVAAHLDPGILIVDEVLAVGDADFQKKCLGKMSEVARRNRTVLLVSHNMAAIQALCGRVLLMEAGRLKASGPPNKMISLHLSDPAAATESLDSRKDRQGDQRIRLEWVAIYPASGRPANPVCLGDDVVFELGYRNRTDAAIAQLEVCIGVYDMQGRAVTFLENRPLHMSVNAAREKGSFICTVKRLPFMPGEYFINIHVQRRGEVLDWIQNAGRFIVHPGNYYNTGKLPFTDLGGVCVDHVWK